MDITSQKTSAMKVFVSIGIVEKLARATVSVIVLRLTSAGFVVDRVRVVPES